MDEGRHPGVEERARARAHGVLVRTETWQALSLGPAPKSGCLAARSRQRRQVQLPGVLRESLRDEFGDLLGHGV